MSALARFTVALATFAACGDDGGMQTMTDARTVDSLAMPDACVPASTQKTVFLSRAGGAWTMGADNAATNTSNVLDMARTLAAWPHDQTNWDAIKTCVTASLKPFAITVTDVDPGSAAHHEIVFTTAYWGAGSANVFSVSAQLCGAQQPANSVAFVFGGQLQASNTAEACELAVSQFAIASTGLDHSRDCKDFLGIYMPACGARSFLDQDVKCGEDSDRNCACGGTTQNSYRKMVQAFGASCM